MTAVKVTFRTVAARPHIDFAPIDAEGLSAEAIDTRLATAVGAVDITGAVVRQKIINLSRETQHALNYTAIRTYKARALHLHLDVTRPESQAPTVENRAKLRATLDEQVETSFGGRALPPEVNREEFVRVGLSYFQGGDPYGLEQPK